ncbi:hypothetical protein AVEN_222659-1 [Araneus ventricosus]|uniref:Uncharacterized protein n=1 Tax=Araneus ventricosus TaxID=182803 RepID=A0A4Y2PTG4_ARAVE|nr:hypothetical protein AVEN_222659-1 [Araneus ventricosus]
MPENIDKNIKSGLISPFPTSTYSYTANLTSSNPGKTFLHIPQRGAGGTIGFQSSESRWGAIFFPPRKKKRTKNKRRRMEESLQVLRLSMNSSQG